MERARFTREQLAPWHDVSTFHCGVPALDVWLRDVARGAISRGYSRVYVWHRDGTVAAFFTLSSYLIRRSELDPRQARGEWRGIPALLLGKLALDEHLQGEGLARVLIADAVRESVRAAEIAGARYLVVDAIDDEVARLYQRFGFMPAGDRSSQERRLLARIADLAAAVQT